MLWIAKEKLKKKRLTKNLSEEIRSTRESLIPGIVACESMILPCLPDILLRRVRVGQDRNDRY